MNNKTTKYVILWIICIIFQSCLLPKKLDKFFHKKPTLAAQKCIQYFPVKETTDTIEVIDSLAIEAYMNEYMYMAMYIDSLLSLKCDTQTRQDIMYLVGRIPEAPCPQKIVTRLVENTAKYQVILDSCRGKSDSLLNVISNKEAQISQALSVINKQAADVQKYKKQRNSSIWWIALLLGVIFRRQIYRGLKKLITKI
jgi:hypothetical protein